MKRDKKTNKEIRWEKVIGSGITLGFMATVIYLLIVIILGM